MKDSEFLGNMKKGEVCGRFKSHTTPYCATNIFGCNLT